MLLMVLILLNQKDTTFYILRKCSPGGPVLLQIKDGYLFFLPITTRTQWIQVNKNYTTINEAAEENDPNSSLNYFRKVVKLRKENPILVYGKYTLLDKDNANVYAYTRELNGRKLLILLNFKSKVATFN